MASITLKNLPESLVKRVRRLAERERRSLSQQILFMVERGLTSAGSATPEAALPAAPLPPALAQAIRSQVAAWQHLAGRWIADEPVEAEIAGIYAARTAGRDVTL